MLRHPPSKGSKFLGLNFHVYASTVVVNVKDTVKTVPGGRGIKLLEKLDSVLQTNPGLQKVNWISIMLSGDESLRLFAINEKL